jgi:hypothetical protein
MAAFAAAQAPWATAAFAHPHSAWFARLPLDELQKTSHKVAKIF